MCLNSEIVLAQDEEAQSAAFLPLSSCIMLHIIAVTASSAHSVRGICVHFLIAENGILRAENRPPQSPFCPFSHVKTAVFCKLLPSKNR